MPRWSPDGRSVALLRQDWFDDTRTILQDCSSGVCGVYLSDGTPIFPNRDAGAVVGRAGKWAAGAWTPSYHGAYAWNGEFPDAAIGPDGAGPDGAYALKLRYHSFGPWDVVDPDGSRWRLTDGDAGVIQLLGNRRAIWMENLDGWLKHTPGLNIAPPSEAAWGFKACEVNGRFVVLYQSRATGRMVLDGHEILPIGDYFYADVRWDGERFHVVWSPTQADTDPQFFSITPAELAACPVAGTTPPPPPPPQIPTLRKPEVTVPKWTLDELKDGREIVFFDRENPALGYESRVWIEDGSVFASITNAVGTGRTGARRPVKPCDGSNPDLPPGNGGGTVDPLPVGWRPSRDDVLTSLRADIAMADHDGQDTEWGTWEALWWDDEKFAAFAQRYHARGLTLVPCNLVVTNYRGVTFDFTNDLPLVKARLERCYQHRLIPMLCLTMVDARDRGGETIAILERILPELRDYLVAVFTAWELEVDGGPSVFTPEEHARVIQLADEHLPGVVIGVEFASPADRGDPVIYDGRAVGDGREAPDYWRRPEAQRLDVVLLEIPHGIVGDPKRVCMEVGGAVCRLQGAFDVPDRFPDGEPITDEYRGNWRTDYGIHKHVVAFEYASFQRWSSARKRELREFVQAVIPIAGFGEG